MSDWQEFYKNTKASPSSALLAKALGFVLTKGAALDVGSGALRDSRFLLSEGFTSVTALDQEMPPPEILEVFPKVRFTFIRSAFEDFAFPEKAFDLVNAQYSLPFVPPPSFDAVWERLTDALIPGGIFSGQFFGVHDEWNVPGKPMTFHAESQVRERLSRYETLSFEEKDFDGKLASGQAKHWHVFHVIARKH